jgi:uncharacterized protein YyaL (SSP411 family)
MHANANSLAMPVLVACLCALPAGLPLSAFLSPSGRLYFGGGYLPVRPSRGKPVFRQVLEQALRVYREQRTEIERDGFDVAQGE